MPAVWQSQRKVVKAVQELCLVWIFLDMRRIGPMWPYLVACVLFNSRVLGLGLGLGLELVSGWLVVMRTYLYNFPLPLSHCLWVCTVPSCWCKFQNRRKVFSMPRWFEQCVRRMKFPRSRNKFADTHIRWYRMIERYPNCWHVAFQWYQVVRH